MSLSNSISPLLCCRIPVACVSFVPKRIGNEILNFR